MAYGSRLVRLSILLGLGVGLAGCSTLDLRGRTQSVALDDNASQRASYAGRQGLVRPAPRTRFEHRPPQAPARSQQRMLAPPERSYVDGWGRVGPERRRGASTTSGGQRDRHAFALPPRVERHTVARTRQRANRNAPSNDPVYERTGSARWIGRSWLGHKTATGEMFDANRLTGAHASLPLPSFLYVTNKRNGRTILIRVNDRVPPTEGRVIIVSQRAAELLDFRDAGRAEVTIQYGGPASPVANEKHEQAFLVKQPWYRSRRAASRPALPDRSSLAQPARRYPRPTYPRWDNTRR